MRVDAWPSGWPGPPINESRQQQQTEGEERLNVLGGGCQSGQSILHEAVTSKRPFEGSQLSDMRPGSCSYFESRTGDDI